MGPRVCESLLSPTYTLHPPATFYTVCIEDLPKPAIHHYNIYSLLLSFKPIKHKNKNKKTKKQNPKQKTFAC